LFHEGDSSKIRADQVSRIADVLAHLDRARHPSDLDLPGYRLHPLNGDLRGMWSVTISGNWRIIFRFEDGDAFDIDLVDYH
jgi:addiction module HigA family antidote